MDPKPPLIVRALLWLFRARPDDDLLPYLRDQQEAAETARTLDAQRRRHRPRGGPYDEVFPPPEGGHR